MLVEPEIQPVTWSFDWRCEKWSEEAVEFCRRKLLREGVTHTPAETCSAFGLVSQRLMPISEGIPSSVLREIIGVPEEYEEIPGNLLVNEGIARLLDLLIAAGGVAYNAANAFVGVGDSTTAEAASQTELQAATNRFYKAMNATFPSRTSQTVSWQSDFTTAEANYAWQEWSISAGATTASGSGFTTGTTNLNRKVQSLGTKTTGTWTLTGQVTIS